MPLNLVWKVLDDFVGYNNELAKTTLEKFRKFNSIMASWAIELVNLAILNMSSTSSSMVVLMSFNG
jgi:hypothetical protein